MSAFGTKSSKREEKKKMEEFISVTKSGLGGLLLFTKIGEKRLIPRVMQKSGCGKKCRGFIGALNKRDKKAFKAL
jgi:hypothetical protein